MERGSIVRIEFTGREVESGRVFDTTDKAEAKKAGIQSEGARYGAATVIVGRGEVLRGIDEALLEMKVGEARALKLAPQKAFGERQRNRIAVMPLREFKVRKIEPVKGLVVEVNGAYGKVQTVSGGRVRVDFNSDLAGREVEYKIKVLGEVKKPEEKLEALREKYLALKGVSTEFKDGVATVRLPKGLPKEIEAVKKVFEGIVKGMVQEVKEVSYVEAEKDAVAEKEAGSGNVEAEKEANGGKKEALEEGAKEHAAEGKLQGKGGNKAGAR